MKSNAVAAVTETSLRGVKLSRNLSNREFPIIWQAKKGHGSFLTFDMGKKLEKRYELKPGSYFKGSHHLWIYMCDWKLIDHDTVVLDSEHIMESELTESILSKFVGSKISSIDLNKTTVSIHFSNGMALELSAYPTGDEEIFMYFEEGHPPLSYSPSKGLSEETPELSSDN